MYICIYSFLYVNMRVNVTESLCLTNMNTIVANDHDINDDGNNNLNGNDNTVSIPLVTVKIGISVNYYLNKKIHVNDDSDDDN